MITDRIMRQVLWAAALYTLGGALMFAFPQTPVGRFAGMPTDAPEIYRYFAALFILLFAGMYAWLAMQPSIVRPMVWLGAIGKVLAFLCVFSLWVFGRALFSGVAVFGGDLFFAVLFVMWLRAGAMARNVAR